VVELEKRSLLAPFWRYLVQDVHLIILGAGLGLSSISANAASTLKVEAANGLPGFHRADLSRYLVSQMAGAQLADWRFEPTEGDSSAPDRVVWSFKLNPYAGGEVRSFVHTLIYQRQLGVRRPVTIEARLYVNGQYQTLVEKQAIVQGGPNDPELAAAVASATQSLLGPAGAYRAIDAAPPRSTHPSR
jgi:hypothetical protein